MDKLVVLLSVINLTVLEIGSLLFPDHSFMWLAGSSPAYVVLRAVVIGLLIALLLTHPPRNFYFRLAVGLTAIGVLFTVLVMTFGVDGTMPILDSLTLAAASVAMGLMAIEVSNEEDYVDVEALRQSKHRGLHAR